MSVADALATVDTEYTADSIEFCPHEGSEQFFTCGTYQVIPVTKSEKSKNSDPNGTAADGPAIGLANGTSDDTVAKPSQNIDSNGSDIDSDEDEATPPAPRVGRLYLFKLEGDTP